MKFPNPFDARSITERFSSQVRSKVVIALVFVGLVFGQATGAMAFFSHSSNPRQASDGAERRTLSFQGTKRVYYLYAPPSARASNPAPLVLVFHGGDSGGADKVIPRYGFQEVARENGFSVVYPEANNVWNDGRATTQSEVDDIGFISALIDHLSASERVDRSRVFATGASAGGMFTLRLACEVSDKIKAFAPVIASFPANYVARCKPTGVVPILMINGTDDTFIPWDGGEIRSGRRRGRGGRVIPVEETVAFWRDHNSCSQRPKVESLSDRDGNDGTTAQRRSFYDCRDGADVRFIEIAGGGHTWPGSPVRPGPIARRLLGNTSYDFKAAELIWRFFDRHSKTNPRSSDEAQPKSGGPSLDQRL